MALFDKPDMNLRIGRVQGTNQGYVEFENIDALLTWIVSVFSGFGDGLYGGFNFFIAGDYDMNEVLKVLSDRRIEHFAAESVSEASMLYGMSRAALNMNIDENQVERFVPLEFSPIQHGAQDNYIDHTFIKEPYTRIVEKVALPSPEIAFFNGVDASWTIINNEYDEECTFVNSCVRQSKEIQEYLRVWGTDIAEHWNFENDENLVSLLHSVGRTYLEDIEGRFWC